MDYFVQDLFVFAAQYITATVSQTEQFCFNPNLKSASLLHWQHFYNVNCHEAMDGCSTENLR